MSGASGPVAVSVSRSLRQPEWPKCEAYWMRSRLDEVHGQLPQGCGLVNAKLDEFFWEWLGAQRRVT